jgi:hypothetical protein
MTDAKLIACCEGVIMTNARLVSFTYSYVLLDVDYGHLNDDELVEQVAGMVDFSDIENAEIEVAQCDCEYEEHWRQ